MDIRAATSTAGWSVIYEFGARISPECAPLFEEYAAKANRVYNDIVASMRRIHDDIESAVWGAAGEEAAALQAEIDSAYDLLKKARAKQDEGAVKDINRLIGEKRKALYPLLYAARKDCKEAIRSMEGQVGNRKECSTYQAAVRSAREQGVNSDTCDQIHRQAMVAWKKLRGIFPQKKPAFKIFGEKTHDTLVVRYRRNKGVGWTPEMLSMQKKGKFMVEWPERFRPKQFGTFSFSVGTESANQRISGTIECHRPFPPNSDITTIRLIRKRLGTDFRYYVQFEVGVSAGIERSIQNRTPYCTVHFGWDASDDSGRRIAAVSESGAPGDARLIVLPKSIEDDFERSAAFKGRTDRLRDEIVPAFRAIDPLDYGAEKNAKLVEHLGKIRKKETQSISRDYLQYIYGLLVDAGPVPENLRAWAVEDERLYNTHRRISDRAQNARKKFYQKEAKHLAETCATIVIEPLELAKAARIRDESTDEKTGFGKKARSGRFLAAPSIFESAIRWAAVKNGAAILEIRGKTVATCGVCGMQDIEEDRENGQVIRCPDCGATLDRKQNGAATAWQMAAPYVEDETVNYWINRRDDREASLVKQKERLRAMQEAKRVIRAARDAVAA